MNQIEIDSADEAVKKFVVSLQAVDRGAVVKLDGKAMICVIPVEPQEAADGLEEWSSEKNERRCALIDREIDGTLSAAEAVELHGLQQAMLRYRRRVAPLPLAEARRLHQELLEKSRNNHRCR